MSAPKIGSVARQTENQVAPAIYVNRVRASKLVSATDTLIWCAAREWVFAALVQALDFIAVKAFITNPHPRAECAHGGKLLDHKTNSLGRSGEPAIAERLAGPTFAFLHK